MMNAKTVAVGEIKPHPKNPRIIRDTKFKDLKKSIQDAPWMLDLRPIVVNDKMEILGGSMRYRAIVDLGWTEVPIIIAGGLTEKQEDEFIIKDNNHAGEWDFDIIANQWEMESLADWGFHVPDMTFTPTYSPQASSRSVTEADIKKESEKMEKGFNISQTTIDVLCPQCGHEFHIEKK